ncbi:MAG: hypothetical protein ACF8XB_08405 [Planctomycetota bacterium JB042]
MTTDPLVVRLERLERAHARLKRFAGILGLVVAATFAGGMDGDDPVAEAAAARVAAAERVLALFDAAETAGRGPSPEVRSDWSALLLRARVEASDAAEVEATRDHLATMDSILGDLERRAESGRASAEDVARARYRAAEARFWWERARGR